MADRGTTASPTMKLTDYIATFLAERGVSTTFGLTGGAVVHVFDSLACSAGIECVFTHHEQSASFAAEAWAKTAGVPGVCVVTTGPGGTNAITGLAAAWLDSVPTIFISGQARLSQTTNRLRVRQVGTQQLNVLPIVGSLTKYAVMLESAADVRRELERCWWTATQGRPGPVWLDLPLDLQWQNVEPEQLAGWDPPADAMPAATGHEVHAALDALRSASRPLVLVGNGVRRADAVAELRRFLDLTGMPFVLTYGTADILPHDHPGNLGRPGLAGQRGANLAIQNCDVLLALGSHLCTPVTGSQFDSFARAGRIVMVDLDADELAHRTVPVDLAIQADVRRFLGACLESNPPRNPGSDRWQQACRDYAGLNAVPPPEFFDGAFSSYTAQDAICSAAREGDVVVVDGGGTNVYVSYQTWRIKPGQRMILSTALCSMGSGLPEAIGAWFGSRPDRVIVLCGDGSLQLNIQELQTIRHHRIPAKIFVFCNDAYLSIRHTQDGFLGSRHVGSHPDHGVSLPDYTQVAEAYGIRAWRARTPEELRAGLPDMMDSPDPVLCAIHVAADQQVVPRQGFARQPDGSFKPLPLEDMEPRLPVEVLDGLMFVPR